MKQKISEAEWQVMDALWTLGGATAAELTAALADTGWNRNTVHTFLTRLAAKGFVCEQGGSPKKYAAAVPREDSVREQTESFVSRVFHGSASRLVRTFLQQNDLSEDEIDELRHLLDDAEARGK